MCGLHVWPELHSKLYSGQSHVCRNAQAAALVANAGGGACGSTSSRLYVESYTAVATAIASASAATSAAQACPSLLPACLQHGPDALAVVLEQAALPLYHCSNATAAQKWLKCLC